MWSSQWDVYAVQLNADAITQIYNYDYNHNHKPVEDCMCSDIAALFTKSYPKITVTQLYVNQSPLQLHLWCCFTMNAEWCSFIPPSQNLPTRTWVRRYCMHRHLVWQPPQVWAVWQHFYSNSKSHIRYHHSVIGVILPKAPWYISWSAVESERIYGSNF